MHPKTIALIFSLSVDLNRFLKDTFGDIEYSYDVKVIGSSRNKNPYAEPTMLLKVGSRGEGVMWLQYELNEAGYGLTIDGIFGNKTLATLLEFQQSCKIEVDGICGKETRNSLKVR